jgi:hypothetical protein
LETTEVLLHPRVLEKYASHVTTASLGAVTDADLKL